METLDQTIKYIKHVINKHRAPKLNISKLKEFRAYANNRYECYRNTRLGGYDIFEDRVVFIAHADNAQIAKYLLEEHRRDCILEQLDQTKKF